MKVTNAKAGCTSQTVMTPPENPVFLTDNQIRHKYYIDFRQSLHTKNLFRQIDGFH